MPFTLKPLPYDRTALEPHMSARTLEFHHGKHHRKYVENLNELIAGKTLERASLETIIRKTFGSKKNEKIFNNAAQVWNHDFFWQSMKPGGGGKPTGELAERIEESFGDFDSFKEEFLEAGKTQFGSGWAWLIVDGRKLKVIKTADAENPLVLKKTALLACDVWEHAYYLDYQNRRSDMIKAFLERLADWDFAAENLAAAGSSVRRRESGVNLGHASRS